jgi:hypothetical protein
MAIETGYSKYTCDRCKRTSYLLPSSPQARDYVGVTRITVDNGKQERVLCSTCLAKYQDLVTKGDQEFTNFMANKPTETTTTSESEA